jgi:hypothetical protein
MSAAVVAGNPRVMWDAAQVLPRLPSSVVYERVRQPLRLQANQEPIGTSPRTTRLRLQYLARLPSRLDHRASDAEEQNLTNDKNFSVRDPSGPEGERTCSATRPWSSPD